jgi:hypothetical protein
VPTENLPEGAPLLVNRYEWKSALELLTYLLGVQTVKDDPDLYERTCRLLLQSQKARDVEEGKKGELFTADSHAEFLRKFPRAAKAYGAGEVRRLAEEISRQRQIFSAA